MPAMIRKFHLAKLAAAGDDAALAADAQTYGSIPNDFYANLMRIAAFNGHRLSGGGAADKQLPVSGNASAAIDLWGTGKPMREFLFVDDLAEALLLVMDNYQSTKLLNIGTGVDQTLRELAEIVRRVVGYPGEITFDSSKPDGTPKKLLDISRLTELGWKPKFTLEEGILAAYESYLK